MLYDMLFSIEAVPTEQLQVSVSVHTSCEDIGLWPVSGLKSLATENSRKGIVVFARFFSPSHVPRQSGYLKKIKLVLPLLGQCKIMHLLPVYLVSSYAIQQAPKTRRIISDIRCIFHVLVE
jgi:hypothetical protein